MRVLSGPPASQNLDHTGYNNFNNNVRSLSSCESYCNRSIIKEAQVRQVEVHVFEDHEFQGSHLSFIYLILIE